MPEVVETVVSERLVERIHTPETITEHGTHQEVAILCGELLQVGITTAPHVLQVKTPEMLERQVDHLQLMDTHATQELLEVARQGPPGPPGPAGATGMAISRSITWSGGRLAGVTFADGRSKAMTWSGDQLARVDTLRPGLPTLRADLSYHPDGTLSAVTQSEV